MKTLFRRWGLITGLMVLLAFSQPVSGEETLPDLFSPPAANARSISLEDPLHPEVLRSRPTQVDFFLLEGIGRSMPLPEEPSFRLNLFDDAQYAVTVIRTEKFSNGALGLVGRVDSGEYNELVIVSHNGVMQAYLHVGQRVFEIRCGGGGHQIVEVDQSAYPDALPPVVPSRIDDPGTETVLSEQDALPAADAGDQIDVLAVYTTAAKNYLGSALEIETHIQTSILSANEGYLNSGINQRLNLVGMEEVDYNENPVNLSQIDRWYYALDRLTFGHTDGESANYLEDARYYREFYGADLVFMVTDLPYIYCGLGWIAGGADQADYGYSVLQVNCTGSGEYTPQHEMGHNMGACHDWINTSSEVRPFCWDDYSYGYQQLNQFYTVMGYPGGCGTCERINRWSDPYGSYEGSPTSGIAPHVDGIPDQTVLPNNTLTLNNTAYNVANYRQSVLAITGRFTGPVLGGVVSSPRDYLKFEAASSEGSITSVAFHVKYDQSWHLIGTDTDGSDGWRVFWSNTGIPQQTLILKTVVSDSAANSREFYLFDVPLSDVQTSIFGYHAKESGTGATLEEIEIQGEAVSIQETIAVPQMAINESLATAEVPAISPNSSFQVLLREGRMQLMY